MLTFPSAPNTTHLLGCPRSLPRTSCSIFGHDAHVPELLKIAYHAPPAQGWGWAGDVYLLSSFCGRRRVKMLVFMWKKALSTLCKCGSCRPRVCLCLKMTPVCLKMIPPKPDPKQGQTPVPSLNPTPPPLQSYRVEMLSHSFHAKECERKLCQRRENAVLAGRKSFGPVAVSDSDFPNQTLQVSESEFPNPRATLVS